jgi:hypothetical protein
VPSCSAAAVLRPPAGAPYVDAICESFAQRDREEALRAELASIASDPRVIALQAKVKRLEKLLAEVEAEWPKRR